MQGVQLYDYQVEALQKMKNGCILKGPVGSGKSRTGLAYYYTMYGGIINGSSYVRMIDPPDLYIITTARKRDTLEWEQELLPFGMCPDNNLNIYKNKIIIDSWNNIPKYKDVNNAFFIFDEQRVVGYGTWVKAFLAIARRNKWILLTATPGDTWSDYLPVFIANGFFKNKTQFNYEHCVFSPYTKFPKIIKYINEGRLIRMRRSIVISIKYTKPTTSHHIQIVCDYNRDKYKDVTKNRWNLYTNEPIKTAQELCLVWRQLVNSDTSRQNAVLDIVMQKKKCLIFYCYDYELEILRKLFENYPHAEWNGHKHEAIPTGDRWVYLLQYSAGCEAWNCITTDTVIFYSQDYSYKHMVQAAGRIDRNNTPYKDLYYYHLKSNSIIDKGITFALNKKKDFNAEDFVVSMSKSQDFHSI